VISQEEKREMLEDAKSSKRKEAFFRARTVGSPKPLSIDEYIQFLTSAQRIFSPNAVSRKKL